MPIEDLDYLYKNSVKENIIILVDSAKRDKNLWLSPNNFQIDFNEPFKYVYGLDILDISIPRTMYSVDYNRSKLFFKVGHSINENNILSEEDELLLEFVSRDYTVRELIEEMGSEGNVLFDNNINVRIDANVSERKSVIEYRNEDQPPKPFFFNFEKSTTNEVLGFNENASSIYEDRYRKIQHPTNSQLFASIPTYLDTLIRNPEWNIKDNVFELNKMDEVSSLPITDEFNQGIIHTNLNQEDYKYMGYFITNMTLLDMNTNSNDSLEFYLYKFDYSDGFPSGVSKQDIIDTFHMVADKTNIQNITGYSSHVSESNIELITNDYFVPLGSNMVFDINKYQDFPYYFKSLPIQSQGNVFYLVYLHDDNQLITKDISTSVDVDVIQEFKIISPGLVQLSGERYITIHCDEIENHLRGSMMFNNYSPGLAMVNLGVQGFSENRIDFFSVKYKEFHPIGKLTGLKFTLKTPDGLMYDLKGVNWHMLVSVKYYVPKKMTSFETSILNPNYNYNFIQYQIDKKELHESSSSEDDISEDEFNRMKRNEIAFQEKLYDEEDSTTDDESD
uniref:DUF5901 domain-containing protein n=1 Tax=viral metagenome TaxID=1070528 RepID=A0A6C0CU13_9ZZZZ